jgi:hypothetical protein
VLRACLFTVAGAPVPSPMVGTNTPGAPAAAAPSDANVTPAGAPLAVPYAVQTQKLAL